MKILLICVNFNSYLSLDEYLKSLDKANNGCKNNSLTVLIGDNSEPFKKISANYTFKLMQFRSDKNLGYFKGVEYAIKKSKLEIEEYDYIIISNVDLKVDKNFFLKLEQMNVLEDVGCIAPAILSVEEKGDRNPKIIKRTNLKKMKILRIMYKYPILHYIYSILVYPLRRKKIQNNKSGLIYAPHGSFMIFTNVFSKFIQKMRFKGFLFGEEIFIAEEIRKAGLKVIYEPSITVFDMEHVSTGEMEKKAYYKSNYQAIDMLIKEYFE